MASTKIYRTMSTPTNQDKGTISMWVKKAKLDGNMGLVENYGDGNNRAILYWNGGEKLSYYDAAAGDSNQSTAEFKDLSGAWVHIVLRIDTSQASASDRVRTYINGNLLAVNATIYQQDENSYMFNSGTQMAFGTDSSSNPVDYMEGAMSHIHYCDGQSYAPTEFAETDSATGEWKIKTSPSVTYGSQGFFILKDGNSVTDQSGNGNNFTISGSLTKTEDSPSNVFAVFNPLVPKHSDMTLSHGNTTISSTNSQWLGSMTTIPLYGGKWYYECKYNTGHGLKLSIVGEQSDFRNFKSANNSYGEYHGNGYGYQFNNSGNDYLGNNNTTPNWGGGLSSNPGTRIYMVAINLENGKIWYGTDGTWFNDASGNTGNPSTDAYPHQTISGTHLAQKPFIVTGSVEGNGATMNWNFGNGYFGTTAVSSAGSNASGFGIFEYDVPTGFTAICTKGLNL